MPDTPSTYRLSCDIGGTFTDFYLINRATGEIDVEKCLTTPGDPSRGVLDGVRMLAGRHPNLLPRTECARQDFQQSIPDATAGRSNA